MAKKGTTKYLSNIQEKEVARQFGGKTVIASGALWFADSDVRSDRYLIECKTTSKDHYPITTSVWEKIENEAIRDNLRNPLLVIDLCNSDRYVIFNPDYFDIVLSDFRRATGRVSKTFNFKGYSDTDTPLLFCLKTNTVVRKEHSLIAMRIADFQEYYKKEL